MSTFRPTILVSDDKTIISLRYIESMLAEDEDEDIVIEKLRDDIILKIRTVSGMEYAISMKMQKTTFGGAGELPSDLKELRNAILERWVDVIA